MSTAYAETASFGEVGIAVVMIRGKRFLYLNVELARQLKKLGIVFEGIPA